MSFLMFPDISYQRVDIKCNIVTIHFSTLKHWDLFKIYTVSHCENSLFDTETSRAFQILHRLHISIYFLLVALFHNIRYQFPGVSSNQIIFQKWKVEFLPFQNKLQSNKLIGNWMFSYLLTYKLLMKIKLF